jgi:hypothetical protein
MNIELSEFNPTRGMVFHISSGDDAESEGLELAILDACVGEKCEFTYAEDTGEYTLTMQVGIDAEEESI